MTGRRMELFGRDGIGDYAYGWLRSLVETMGEDTPERVKHSIRELYEDMKEVMERED